jgi:hypothetical protein
MRDVLHESQLNALATTLSKTDFAEVLDAVFADIDRIRESLEAPTDGQGVTGRQLAHKLVGLSSQFSLGSLEEASRAMLAQKSDLSPTDRKILVAEITKVIPVLRQYRMRRG